MTNTHRNELARRLAQIDQEFAETMEMASDATEEYRELAIEFIPVLEELRREVEAELRFCNE